MKQMSLIEMDGFLKGKCIPRDLKVNETNAEYLVRKFGELESKLETALRECRSAGITIDNLEAKCTSLRVQAELSVAAERAWERAMMYACGEDGPKSVADKFSALEAKCAALAAENSGMKAGILQASENMEAHHDDHGLFSYDADGEQMDALLRLCDAQDSIASLENVNTPATDAFLAEARALLDELEAKDRRNAELNSTVERWATEREQSASELDNAKKLIAELELKLEAADKLQDSAFRHGLQHGFSLGQTDNQAGFEECLSAYGTRGKDNG